MTDNFRQLLALLLIAAGPIAWIISEIVARPLIRRLCGVFALGSMLIVGMLLGLLEDIKLNRAYSALTHEFLQTAATSLRENKNGQVLNAFEHASMKLQETYEDSHYLKITKEAIEEMKR